MQYPAQHLVQAQLNLILHQVQEALRRYFRKLYPRSTAADIEEVLADYWDGILQDAQSPFEQYGALLEWCEQCDEEDAKEGTVNAVKTAFMPLHQQCFAEQLRQSKARYERMVRQVSYQHNKVLEQCQQQRQRLALHVRQTTQEVEVLHQANLHMAILNSDALHAATPQPIKARHVQRLKQLADELILPEALLPLPERVTATHVIPPLQESTLYQQQMTLAALENNLARYRDQLQQESTAMRFFKWFSPARSARWVALRTYQNQIAPLQNVAAKYAAAKAWLEQQWQENPPDKESRFYRWCLAPFMENLLQDEFEQLPSMRQKSQTALETYHQQTQKALLEHNATVQQLNQELITLSKQHQALHTNAKSFVVTAAVIRENNQDKCLPYLQSTICSARQLLTGEPQAYYAKNAHHNPYYLSLLYTAGQKLHNLLVGETNTKRLKARLAQWRDALAYHQNAVNPSLKKSERDKELEKIYGEVQRYRTLAQRLHQFDVAWLPRFIQATMEGAIGASIPNPYGDIKTSHPEKLDEEYVDLLVHLFGNEEQQERWREVLLPVIQSNHAHQARSTLQMAL